MTASIEVRPQADTQLDTVANAARRRLLVTLLEEHQAGNRPIKITEWLGETDTAATLRTLHHNHLPKLESRGFIRWDREHRLVTPGPQFTEIVPLLAVLQNQWNERPDGYQ